MGCLTYQAEGLVVPEKIKAAVKEYREAEDILGQFIDEACITRKKVEIQAGRLFSAYREWCAGNGYKAQGVRRVSRETWICASTHTKTATNISSASPWRLTILRVRWGKTTSVNISV